MKLVKFAVRIIVLALILTPVLGLGFGAWTIWGKVSEARVRAHAAADRLRGTRFYGTAFEDYGSIGARLNDSFVSFDPALPLVYVGEHGMFPFFLASDLRTVIVDVPDGSQHLMRFEIVLSSDLQQLTLREVLDGVTITGTLNRNDQGPWRHKVKPFAESLGL